MKTVTCKLPFLGAACLLLALASAASAQSTITFSGEGGSAQNNFGNGAADNHAVYGVTVSAIIGGDTSKNFAFQLPVYGELKAAGVPSDSYADLIAGADFAIRYKNFSVGPGGNYGYVFRGDVQDRTCLSQPVRLDSSCEVSTASDQGNNGMRDVGSLNLLGMGGFAKYNFGPQGRAFVQGRYIYYGKSMGHLINRGELQSLSTVDLTQFNLPSIPDIADYPEFAGGHDIRATAGYMFHGGKFLRGQFVDRQLNFTHTLGNLSGVFDQRSRTFTIGGGFVF